MKTFDEYKNEVAREFGFSSFTKLEIDGTFALQYMVEQKAASLYATEAIKADREQIIKANPVDCDFVNDSKKYEGYLLEEVIRKLPINLE